MTSKVKMGILVSAVWPLLILRLAIEKSLPGYGTELFLVDFIAFSIFPLLGMGGLWWIRNRKRHEKP